MIGLANLTDEQRRFAVHEGGAFVHACPGAGKTRTIIARLANIAGGLPPRRGVAVLSFTNSAVDEFRERCRDGGGDSLLKYPSFMGTVDAFVRQFIVLPGCGTTTAVCPLILDSWESLGVEIRLNGQDAFRGGGVSLDFFDPETNAISVNLIGHVGLRAHVQQHQQRYEQIAARRRQTLTAMGYLSTNDARVEMRRLIADARRGHALGCALAARFSEVMVDEGQDCNPLDLEVLAWLRRHGVNVTFVCDPDQAIYGFRHGNPDGLRTVRGTYEPNARYTLSGNFRSTQPICRFAATLRNEGNIDQAVGDCAHLMHPVVLMTYRGRAPDASIGRAFLAQVVACGIQATRSIVLAHVGKVAQHAAGDSRTTDSPGTSRVEELVCALAEFWSVVATSRAKENALQSIERLLLDLMGIRREGEHLVRALQRTAINRRVHRRQSLTLLTELSKTYPDTDEARNGWIDALHAKVETLQLDLQPGQTIRGFFRRPPNGRWSSHLRSPLEPCLDHCTIHAAKGRQYDAVCVVIPPNRAPGNRSEVLVASWENRTDEESKRVLYVGATRARKLAVLAVPAVFAERCAALLVAGAVPHVRHDLVGGN